MSDSKISDVVQQITSTAHGILSRSSDDVQSYANQLQQCRNMRGHLEHLDGQIVLLARSFLSAMVDLQQGQYVNEELRALAAGMDQFGQLAESLSNHLHMRHLSYINERARLITATMNEALGS